MLAVIHRQRIKQLEIAVEALNPSTVEKETFELISEHEKVVTELNEIIHSLTDQLRMYKEQEQRERDNKVPWET